MFHISNLSVHYSGHYLFDDISFLINQKDKIGLVGRNGAGKSTLLKIIAGQQTPEAGEVVMPEGKRVGYLPQEMHFPKGQTVIAEAEKAFDKLLKLDKEIAELNDAIATHTDYESEDYHKLLDKLHVKHEQYNLMGGYNTEAELEKVLTGLGFSREDLNRSLDEFSGGWKMRVELAKILLRQPDLLLLDEPTNHLDIDSILWLEDFLKNYPGAIMMVSHDKLFLDNITNRTIEITLGRIEDYKVPYSKYVEQRKERKEQQQAAYENQQKYIAQQERFIERFKAKATKARQAQSRVKLLDKLERIELEEEDTATIAFRFPPAPRSGEVVLEAKKVSKNYGPKEVLKNVDFIIEKGDSVAFVGKNGTGKTTMSKIIVGQTDYEGTIKNGHNVEIGYYAQVQEGTLDLEKTVLQTIEDIATGEWSNIAKIRGLLGTFLFGEDDIDKKVKVLSGGEKSRLALARLLLKPVNLLVLDEPTNHLDMRSKQVLKEALLNFDGTLIVVSHDRDFLDGLTDKTFEFSNKKVREHLGDINEFLKKHKAETFRQFEADKAPAKSSSAPKTEKDNNGLSNKELYALRKEVDKDIRKHQKQVEKAEARIESLEKEIKTIEKELQDPELYKKAMESNSDIFSKYENLKKELESEMEKWQKASEALEKAEQQKEEIN